MVTWDYILPMNSKVSINCFVHYYKYPSRKETYLMIWNYLLLILVKEAEEATYNMIAQLQSTQNRYFERSKYFEKWNGSISDQLGDLRNKIDEIRHLANSVCLEIIYFFENFIFFWTILFLVYFILQIHLSLSSKNDQELCTRSYQLKFLKPSITNYISMTYAISSSHRDALLFYLAGSSSVCIILLLNSLLLKKLV